MGGVERGRGRRVQVLRARDAALPVGRAAHGAPEELRGRRRGRALPPPHGAKGAAPDRLRRIRPAGREPCDQDRRAPARRDREVDRPVPARVPRVGRLVRLVARARDERPALLPLDAVAVPALPRARAGLPQGGRGQLVPEGRDGAGQRAGDRRPLRALRHAGRGPPARAVVLPHHRLRRPAARRPGDRRLARARRRDAAQLDRTLPGRRGHVHLRRAGHRLPRLHDPSRHAVRRDLLRDGARAPGPAPPDGRNRARAAGARLRQQGPQRGPHRARRGRSREDGRAARAHASSIPSTASRSRCGSPTTC